MAKLVRAVHVTDPKSGRRLVLAPGEEPAPHLAAMVTNLAAWEGGKLPSAAKKATDQGDDAGDARATSNTADTPPSKAPADEDPKPAARKTAARKPAAKPAAE